MLEVQIKTAIPESCALGALKEVLNSSITKVEGLTKIDKHVKGLLQIKARGVEDVLANLPSYCEGFVLSPQEAKVLIREHTCFLALAILESGCLITNAELIDREVVWNVVCDDDSFLSLMNKLEDCDIDSELLYKGRPDKKSEMTFREEEILRISLEEGYFDFPKRIKLEELAKKFDLSLIHI